MTYRYPGGLIRRTAANTAITGASGVWDLGSQAQAVKNNTWPISGLANPISGSLRFRSSASASLSRTPASASNRRTWTWSGWIKRGDVSTNEMTFFSAGTDGNNFTALAWNNNNLFFQNYTSGTQVTATSTAVFRDPSAWYHVVLAIDTTQATAADRAKIYVNGVQQAGFSGSSLTLNQQFWINFTYRHTISARSLSSIDSFTDQYMSEINMVDGQALTPASFGQTSAITGVWEPIKYTGTYGTNGFYLSLSDTSSIGKDFSGNGNNWTPNNISTANDSTFDLMRDVPTQYTPQGATDVGGTVRGNYCVLNPIFNVNGTNVTYSNGNLTYSHPSNSGNAQLMAVRGTIALPAGKYYWEYIVGATVNDQVGIGNDVALGGSPDGTAGARYINSGAFQSNYTNPASAASYTTNDIIGVAYDQPNGTLAFYKNNSLQGTITNISTSEVFFPSRSPSSSGTGGAGSFNFGQQPFAYTPPTGYVALNTFNLPTPTIGATASTTANKYFDATLYTGNGTVLGSTQTITNAGSFQPDLVWLKSRSNAQDNNLYDAVRGISGTGSPALFSNLTDAETTYTGYGVSALNSNGFTLIGNGGLSNNNGFTYVGWQWRASNATAVTNTSGSITSTVSANTTAGFSIVTYTGTGANATVGHGLGVAPSMVIIKNRDSGAIGGAVYHTSIGATKYLKLFQTTTGYDAEATDNTAWNGSSPTFDTNVFSVGSLNRTNSAQQMVAYCFAQVAGYSAFGSYTGNGVTDGPFIFTGFRPRFVLLKSSSAATDWYIYDTARDTYNVATLELNPNLSAVEQNGTYGSMDINSNGFKLRFATGEVNASGATYIYYAVAENSFKYARAR